MAKKAASQNKTENTDTVVIHWKSIGLGIVAGIVILLSLQAIGARLAEVSFLGLKFDIPTPTASSLAVSAGQAVPSVSLVGLTFKTGGWNPRVTDLRTASETGIPVWPNEALEFSDLWVYTPKGSNTSEVLIEFYVNDIFIGKIERFPVETGLKHISKVFIQENFKFQEIPGSYWRVENSWKQINIVLINYDHAGTKTAVNEFPVKLNPQSTSWLIAPPDVSITSFAYTINDGPETWVDIHDALVNGLRLQIGEKFQLTQILYRTEFAAPDQSFGIEISIPDTKDSYINNSGTALTEAGTHSLSGFSKPFKWIIQEDARVLSIRFSRMDGTVLDYMEIPVKK